MERVDIIIRFFQNGGIFMYPILLVLALGVGIAIERYVYLTSLRRSNQHAWKELMGLLSRRDYEGALQITRRSTAAIATILGYGLERSLTAWKRDDIETAMEEGLIEILPRIERRTHYLGIFANVSTLLGLLGTIIGLIQAFTAVSSANPAERAEMLSASISVAMNTTAFGLMVAIPLLLIHTVLQTKTTELVDSLEMASVKFLNILVEAPPSGAEGTPMPRRPAVEAGHPGGAAPMDSEQRVGLFGSGTS
jgi:biopolymer transport protein ExbB